MTSLRLPIDVVRLPLAAAVVVVSGPARGAERLYRTLGNLEELADGVARLGDDMARMRTAVESLSGKVDRLRDEVRAMDGSVGGLRSATESLDGRVEGLAGRLVAVDSP